MCKETSINKIKKNPLLKGYDYVPLLSDSNRKSLNLSNNFRSFYLRFDNFPKNIAKVFVLFVIKYNI